LTVSNHDGDYGTDQGQFIRMVNASTGEEVWDSDDFYCIHTEAPNQPRLVDIDHDGLAELIMLVGYDSGYAVWTMYKYSGVTGKPKATKPARPPHQHPPKPTKGAAARTQN
jgi:hypothetical protein